METDIIIAIIGAFLGEIYGNFVGGGSIVTQIALQNLIGMPIKEAMALDNAAVIGSNIGVLIMIIWHHKIKWWMAPFILFQTLGAFLGVEILVWISESSLKIIFIGAILALVIKSFFFSSSSQKKEEGFNDSYKNIAFLCLAAIFTGAYNSAFVIGDMAIALLIYTTLFHFRYQSAMFLIVFSTVFSQPFATWGYIQNDLLNMNYFIPLTITMLIAGLIAGYFLQKINSDILEKVLKYLSVVLVGYLIWGIIV